jgi:phospholipid/cholesterol/gamma-HCH transport system substrate-binding protein
VVSAIPGQWTTDPEPEARPGAAPKSPPPRWMSVLDDQRDNWAERLANPLSGLAFLLVIALLMGLSVASYQKVFTDVVTVTLETDRIGSQLREASDVKARGLVVGEVRRISTTGDGARLELALEPDQVPQIPSNVSARLLPKTLFGERYVDLALPKSPARPLREGDTIPQDRSSVAIELEQVFEDLLPLLRTVRPERLAATLNALAGTLDGRGTLLGQNLVLVDGYFKQVNPHLPAIQADISGLADLASTYAVAAPELVRAAKALTTTNTTIVERQNQLAGFFAGTAGFANTAGGFLEDNGDRIIRAGRVNRPTLALFAEASPQYPCVTEALVDWIPNIDGAWKNEEFHITLEVSAPRVGYVQGEEPAWGEKGPPTCSFLPDPPGSQEEPVPSKRFEDGTYNRYSYKKNPQPQAALPAVFTAMDGAAVPDPDAGLAGTAEEQRLLVALLDASGRTSAITTLLAGPILRGTVVHQSPQR